MIKFHVVDVAPGAQDSGLLGAAGNLLGGAGQGGNHEPPSFDQKQTHNCSIWAIWVADTTSILQIFMASQEEIFWEVWLAAKVATCWPAWGALPLPQTLQVDNDNDDMTWLGKWKTSLCHWEASPTSQVAKQGRGAWEEMALIEFCKKNYFYGFSLKLYF